MEKGVSTKEEVFRDGEGGGSGKEKRKWTKRCLIS